NAQIPPNFRFCPQCGFRVQQAQQFDVETRVGPSAKAAPAAEPARPAMNFGGAIQTARAKLTLIRGDGEDGVTFTLAGTDHIAGRGECPISFPDDPFLSPTHANFIYANNQLKVRDEQSLNGVYVRIAGTVQLTAGAVVLV